MKKRFLSVLAMMLVIVLALAACTSTPAPSESTPEVSEETPSESSGEPEAEGPMELKIGTPEHNGIYNAMYRASAYDAQVCDLVYESLSTIDESGKYVVNDRLVEEMTISEDKLTYTFKMKPGIKFTNGEELKASDVFFTYKALADPSSTARNVSALQGLLDVKKYQDKESADFTSLTLVDDYTIEFHFEKVLRTNLSVAAVGILSEAHYPDFAYDDVDASMNAKMEDPVGTGPYKLETYAAKEYVSLVKNEDFSEADKYDIERLVIKFINSELANEELISGEIDLFPGEINLAKVTAAKEANMELNQYKRSAFGYIAYNNAEGVMSEKAIRQAISYSIDRDAFVESEYGDLANVPNIPMSQASSIYDNVQDQIVHYTKDTAKAIELFESAGYKYEGDKMLDADGNQVKIRFAATSENSVVEALIPLLTDDFAEIGILLESEYLEFATLLTKIQQPDAKDWDIYFMASSWSSDEPDTWVSFTTDMIPGQNTVRFSNAEFDKLIADGKSFLDLSSKEAQDHYAKAAIILNDEIPELPMYANIITDITVPQVKGYHASTFVPWSKSLDGVTVER